MKFYMIALSDKENERIACEAAFTRKGCYVRAYHDSEKIAGSNKSGWLHFTKLSDMNKKKVIGHFWTIAEKVAQ